MGTITHAFVDEIPDDPEAAAEGEVLPSHWNDDHVIDLDKSDVGLSNVDNTSDADKPISTATQTALDGKVDENAAITPATKTKITYDAKGLVTAGADATTADIADSTDRRYVTDAQQTVIGNTSGTNTGDVTVIGQNYLSLTGQIITAGAVNLSGSNATGTLAAGRFPALTGDVTTSAGALATTLATVNSNPGTFGSATKVPVFVVNGKGLVTAVLEQTISGVAPGGSAGGDLTGTYPNPTIDANKVTDAKLRQSAALSVIGNATNATANVADITAASDGQVLRRSGTALGFGAVNLASGNAVTGTLPNARTTADSANTASAIVARDASGNFTAGTATLSGLTVQSTGSVLPTVSTTTTGSLNEAGFILNRGDQANGYAQVHYRTAGTNTWTVGMRAGDARLHIYDVVNGMDQVLIDQANAGSVTIMKTTASSSTGTGSLVTLGGIGVAGDAWAANVISAGKMALSAGGTSGNDYLLRTANDTNHALGYYGTGKLWNSVAIDGPVLYGFGGGALGTRNGSTQRSALTWDSSNNVSVVNTLSVGNGGSVSHAGSASNAGAMFGFNSPGSPTAGNIFGVGIQKSGVDLLYFGINKNSTTGAVPASACFISSYGSGSSISIGRGNNAGSLSTSDILINGSGNVSVTNDLSVGTNFSVGGYSAYQCRAWCNFSGTGNSNIGGTYVRSGTTVTVTAVGHGQLVGSLVYLDFITGTATDGAFSVTAATSSTFDVTHGTSGATSGNVTITRNTIRASANVSSVADRGTGAPAVNLTTAVADANYSVGATVQGDSNYGVLLDAALASSSPLTTASIPLTVTGSGGTRVDSNTVCVQIFR